MRCRARPRAARPPLDTPMLPRKMGVVSALGAEAASGAPKAARRRPECPAAGPLACGPRGRGLRGRRRQQPAMRRGMSPISECSSPSLGRSRAKCRGRRRLGESEERREEGTRGVEPHCMKTAKGCNSAFAWARGKMAASSGCSSALAATLRSGTSGARPAAAPGRSVFLSLLKDTSKSRPAPPSTGGASSSEPSSATAGAF
mmetsp:Transcript_74304/g.234681  ORF Transcript_74304/g.234681 Transcript_74304/m.234681 type:complete len:202 (-) Transcript_74304:2131-2736(-)